MKDLFETIAQATKPVTSPLKKGMIFDLHQDGKETIRAMAINENQAVNLSTLEIINDIDFHNEVDLVLINNIFKYTCEE